MNERQLLKEVAEQIERWVKETQEGGWSTYHVETMEQKAKEIYSFLGASEVPPVDKEILEDILEMKRFMGIPGVHQAISRDLLIRIDSLLSCLVHRHGSVLDQINEAEEVKELASIVRKHTS